VQWYDATNGSYNIGLGDALHAAIDNGHIAIAAWLVARYVLIPANLERRPYLTRAVDIGDVRMADWLLDFGYVPTYGESGCDLLRDACVTGMLDFAAWVLRRFPIALTYELLLSITRDACESGAACSARWLIEEFEVSQDDRETLCAKLMDTLVDNDDDQSVPIQAWIWRTCPRLHRPQIDDGSGFFIMQD
jgi:hypothetical protein